MKSYRRLDSRVTNPMVQQFRDAGSNFRLVSPAPTDVLYFQEPMHKCNVFAMSCLDDKAEAIAMFTFRINTCYCARSSFAKGQ